MKIIESELLEKMAERMYSKYLPDEDRFETQDEIRIRLREFFNEIRTEEPKQDFID